MAENKPVRTPLSELGEFGLIRHLTEGIELKHPSSLKGVGDDCAVLRPPDGQEVLVTTDLLLEGIHFDLSYVPLRHLGYKAVAVNVSDIYAMNGTPAQVTVSIGVSQRFSVEDLEELYYGIRAACQFYDVDLVGGDTSASLTGLSISVTAVGYAPKDAICYRSGAQVNDLVCVTGNYGAAFMGLQVLEREKKVLKDHPEATLDLKQYTYVLQRHLQPQARRDAVEMLREAGLKPNAMMDVSDGLSSEILHICHASGVGARIYPERIPIDQQTLSVCEEMGMDPLTAALNGGEDYELLFTVPLAAQKKVDDMGINTIGYIAKPEAGVVAVTSDGSEVPIRAQGWNAFGGTNTK
ncbi:MAG: thiamine-phosphate kinase [Bacteroides sp.]